MKKFKYESPTHKNKTTFKKVFMQFKSNPLSPRSTDVWYSCLD